MDKISRLLEKLSANGLDAAIISHGVNRTYLSGFTGSNALLLISPGERKLFTDGRYTRMAAQQAPLFEVVEVPRGDDFAALSAALKAGGYESIGYEDAHITVREFGRLGAALGARLVPLEGCVDGLRLIKTAEELERIKRAAAIADRAYAATLEMLREGVSELDIQAELEYRMLKLGAQGPSFASIVAFGENSALPHAQPSGRTLKPGDAVLIDCGCMVGGYCSDMTRTVFFGGVSDELKRVYDTVLSAQLAALGRLAPGIAASEVDAAARECIQNTGYGELFCHSLGHGVGLQVHEPPTAAPQSGDMLGAGMTLTVEPGVYVDGVGGVRIEDLCVITQMGFENLTCAPKELKII